MKKFVIRRYQPGRYTLFVLNERNAYVGIGKITKIGRDNWAAGYWGWSGKRNTMWNAPTLRDARSTLLSYHFGK